jgi:hypothetical protein
MRGLNLSAQAAFFGLAYWASLELEPSVSPRLVHPQPVANRTPKKGLFGEVTGGQKCDCDPCTAGNAVAHKHACDDCVFCKARAKRAALAANAPHLPLHRQPGYRVQPPDVLFVSVTHSGSAAADTPPFEGECLVRSDGKIDLGNWGEVPVEDKTVDEIRHAIEQLVEAESGACSVHVSVFAQNSKVYYVVEKDSFSSGAKVHRFPITGNETALDALSQVGRLNELSRKQMWVARPVLGGPDEVLPINWQWTGPTTITGNNPPLMPNDRIIVQTPPTWMAFVEHAATFTHTDRYENASAAKPTAPGEDSTSK